MADKAKPAAVEMRAGGRRSRKTSEAWEKVLTEWLASQDRPKQHRLTLLCHPDDLPMRRSELRLLVLLHPEWEGATVSASSMVWKGSLFVVERRQLLLYQVGTDG